MAVKYTALHAGRALLRELVSGTHFCKRLSKPQDHGVAGSIKKTENKIYDVNGNRTCDIMERRVMSQLRYSLPLSVKNKKIKSAEV